MTLIGLCALPRLRRCYAALGVCGMLLAGAAGLSPASAAVEDGESLFGNYLAARHAVNLRDVAGAAEFYRKALRLDPKNEVILERAFLLQLSNGDLEQAVPLAERLIKVEPKHRIARLTLGVKAMRGRQFAVARRHFGQSAERGPIAEMTSAFMTAWSHRGAGDSDAALKTLDKIEGSEWYQVNRAYHAALIADLAGRDTVAQARFAEAHKLDPSALRIVEGYVRHLLRKGKRDQAGKLLDEFDKLSEDHPMMRPVRADLAAGRAPEPLIKSAAGGAAEGLYGIGAALSREGGEDLAIVYLQLALYLAPDFTLPQLTLANIHETHKNYALAVAAYERVPATSPLKRNADVQRALNLNQLGRIDDAIAALEAQIKQTPDNLPAIIALGNVLRAHERYAQAADIYSRAVAQIDANDERRWTVFYFRGVSYERAKQWPLAEADLSKALQMNPKEALILNYLGYSWVDQGLHLDKAMDMIKQAVELKPNDGYIVDSLGWAYYRIGDFEKEVQELERAVELRPGDPVINDHLGDAYWRVGRRLEAMFQWSHAKVLDPDPAELTKIEAKLKGGLDAGPRDRAWIGKQQNNGG